MLEKRKYPRTKISFPIEYTCLNKQQYFYTVGKNLNNHGIKIILDRSIAKGQKLLLTVNFINKLLTIPAEIRWCNKDKKYYYLAGLKFLNKIEEDILS